MDIHKNSLTGHVSYAVVLLKHSFLQGLFSVQFVVIITNIESCNRPSTMTDQQLTFCKYKYTGNQYKEK